MGAKRGKIDKEENKFDFRSLFTIIALVAIVGIVVFAVKKPTTNNYGQASKQDQNAQEIKVPEDNTATIVAIGDTLCHSQVFKDAYDSSTGVYDFSPMFKDVTKYFQNKTVAVGNLEATLAGPSKPYSGYPTFNTPEHLAIDLKELGLDIMTTANNHSLDIGYSGLVSSLNYLDQAGLEHTGTARSKEEQDKILFKDLNGIKTAFLAFTYGTNGIPVPAGKEYCVNLIDKDFIKQKIDQAKAEGAEAICVSMHWGVEYQTKENSEQDELAEFLIKNDVNVILGCHPHVLQPLEMKEVTMEDGTKKSGVVIYSMGNFFSAQTFPNTRDTVIMNIKIRQSGEDGKISIDHAKYAPVYDYDNGMNAKDRYELLDLDGIIDSYEAGEKDENGNLKWSKKMYDLAKTEKARIEKIVGPEIINRTEDGQIINAKSTEAENNTIENKTENKYDKVY